MCRRGRGKGREAMRGHWAGAARGEGTHVAAPPGWHPSSAAPLTSQQCVAALLRATAYSRFSTSLLFPGSSPESPRRLSPWTGKEAEHKERADGQEDTEGHCDGMRGGGGGANLCPLVSSPGITSPLRTRPFRRPPRVGASSLRIRRSRQPAGRQPSPSPHVVAIVHGCAKLNEALIQRVGNGRHTFGHHHLGLSPTPLQTDDVPLPKATPPAPPGFQGSVFKDSLQKRPTLVQPWCSHTQGTAVAPVFLTFTFRQADKNPLSVVLFWG